MELSIHYSADTRLSELQLQFLLLDRELVDIQTDYDRLRTQHGRQCAQSLTRALSGLLEVTKYVNKTDKALIYWVEKRSVVKLALRCVGVDKRTQVIVKTKTTHIQSQVSKVENHFHRSTETFKTSLKAAQDFNTRVTRYSLTSLGAAEQQAMTVSEDLDDSLNTVETQLEMSQLECQVMEEEIAIIPSQINGVETRRQTAQDASDLSANVRIRDATLLFESSILTSSRT
jgi:hypothetical protein